MGKILIKNGRVWDGERFLDADVLTDGTVIARIAKGIDESADFLFDAKGMTVSAGLVDAHTHMLGLSGPMYAISAEAACFPFGATAAIEAGSRLGNRKTVEQLAVKVLVFADTKTENNHINMQYTEELLAGFGDKAIGIKLFFDRTSPNVVDITPLKEACAFARERSLKVLVHCNHSPASMLEIVETLAPGDVLTHIYHGGRNNCQEQDYAAFKLAREKGVILDAGFAGHIHTSLSVFRQAVVDGYLPDCLGTDITCSSGYKRGGRYGLTMCMSMARTAGMKEEDIFRAVTYTPAVAHGLGGHCGLLREGGCADIAVLEYGSEGFSLTDRFGNMLESNQGYRCKMTVADGVIVWRD